MSWDHWVESRKKTRTSLATNWRTVTEPGTRSPSHPRVRARPSRRSCPSWARENPWGTSGCGARPPGPRRRPPCGAQEKEGEGIPTPPEPPQEALGGPLAGKPGGGGGAEGRHEVHHGPELVGADQALGLEEPDHHHHPGGGEEPQEGQEVPGAPGREDVHQEEGEGRPRHGGKDQEGPQHPHRQEVVPRAGGIHHPVGRQEGDRQEDHHPRGVHQALHQPGPVELHRVRGRGQEELQVPGEEEGGEGGDDVGEEEDEEEGEEGDPQELPRQEIPDPLRPPEVEEHPVDEAEEEGPEPQGGSPQEGQADEARVPAHGAVHLPPELGVEEGPEPRSEVPLPHRLTPRPAPPGPPGGPPPDRRRPRPR
jgi:hypothetical protein